MNLSDYFSYGRSILSVFLIFSFNNNTSAFNPDPDYSSNKYDISVANCFSGLTCINGTVPSGCEICARSSMDDHTIANAVDYSPSTFWESEPLILEDNCNASISDEIIIDLGDQRWVEAIQLYYWQTECPCNTNDYKTHIYQSDDQIDWGTPIASFDYETAFSTKTYATNNPQRTRYLKIEVAGCPMAWQRVRMNDIKVFGITGDCSDNFPDNFTAGKDVNPDHLLTEELGQSPYSYSGMIGINAGPEWDCFYSPTSYCGPNPFKNMFSHVRSFHLMEKDYQNHNSPWEGGCTPCLEANASQCTPAQRGDQGPLRIGLNGGVGLYKLRYTHWKWDGFTKSKPH